MKKSSVLSVACALLMGQSTFAQSTATAVTFVEDPAQGYTFNQFKDNWFISAEGGANIFFSHRDIYRNTSDRIAPAASIWVGKWFSPVFGFRVGANWLQNKGLADKADNYGVLQGEHMVNGKFYKTKVNEFGPQFSAMLNLTNWWCGYHPGRIYNATAYVGGGAYWSTVKTYKNNGESDGWHNGHDRGISLHTGLINAFNVSKQVQLYLDIRYTMINGHADRMYAANTNNHDLAAYLGVTYNFPKREWTAPVVPVVAEVQDCDAIEQRLQAANARINELDRQLRDCLDRPVTTTVQNEGPLATIYYPIGVSRLNNVDHKVLGAIAEIMKSNPDQKYVLTGWADNYTGTEQVNARLRRARVDGVQKVLVNNGVNASQLDATVNNGNLNDMGEKFVSLDRAVTIEEAK